MSAVEKTEVLARVASSSVPKRKASRFRREFLKGKSGSGWPQLSCSHIPAT